MVSLELHYRINIYSDILCFQVLGDSFNYALQLRQRLTEKPDAPNNRYDQ